MSNEASFLQLTRHGDGEHVLEIALDRPSALNAVSTEFARQIAAVTTQVSTDQTVRAVVLTSTHEKAFCVGADLKERNGFSDAELMHQRPIAQAAYGGVLRLPVPVISAVDGFALGGGLEIALSGDLIVAGESATVGLPEVSVGVIPGGGGTQLLTRRIGWSRAASLIFTAARIDAAQAHRLGVVDELVPAGQARERALAIAAVIASHSPIGVRQAKRAMRLGLDVDLETGLQVEDAGWRATAFSADRSEGIAAFAEKRRPAWPASDPAGP